ncbi:MAG: bifunctional precorrin-2 dehydrogenase/sirohydrochlorin ferrochelatase [Candidatus Omnitrophota bacterium]
MSVITHYYPIALNLKNKLALVVGGGEVSERKVKGLLKTGARVTIVSPEMTPLLRRLARQRKVKWVKRPVKEPDVAGANIIIAATSDQAVNRRVSLWAKQRKILVNAVDRPRLSDFISPAVLRAAKAIVAVYTNGRDPLLSKDLKDFLKEHWDVFLSYRHRL